MNSAGIQITPTYANLHQFKALCGSDARPILYAPRPQINTVTQNIPQIILTLLRENTNIIKAMIEQVAIMRIPAKEKAQRENNRLNALVMLAMQTKYTPGIVQRKEKALPLERQGRTIL